jgi:glucose-6-phosphate isomerase, archaeal
MNAPNPCAIRVDLLSGMLEGATAHYQKRLNDMRGFYRDPRSLQRRIVEEGNPICYENFAFNQNVEEGDLFFGTTVIYPGKVGREYHFTRGHIHKLANRGETYQALAGRGLVLFERDGYEPCTAELAPGRITYIPPFWIHRSVNTGSDVLVFLWTCPTDAGHDYSVIGAEGLAQIVVEHEGRPTVQLNSSHGVQP